MSYSSQSVGRRAALASAGTASRPRAVAGKDVDYRDGAADLQGFVVADAAKDKRPAFW